MDLEKRKNCGKITNKQIIFTYLWAFTYLFLDFIWHFGKKSHKIEHAFKTHD